MSNQQEVTTILTDMIRFQDKFNSQLDENWKNSGNNYLRALRVEMTEAVCHIGFKWWKHEEPNYDQAFIEVVDAIHFALSEYIKQNPDATHEEIAEKIVQSEKLYDNWEREWERSDAESIIEWCEAIVGLTINTGCPTMLFSYLFYLANLMGYSCREVAEAYLQKGVLNEFRQDNGYMDGTYEKVWFGLEDNECLRMITIDAPERSTDIEYLKQVLGKMYTEFLKSKQEKLND